MERLIIPIFFVYGVTVIVTSSDGPFGLFYRIREISDLAKCFMCFSVYMAALVSIFIATSIPEFIVYTFAISGAAILLDRITYGK